MMVVYCHLSLPPQVATSLEVLLEGSQSRAPTVQSSDLDLAGADQYLLKAYIPCSTVVLSSY